MEGGPKHGETVPLGSTTTLGRHPGCDVVVAETGVSRRHAEIVEAGTEYRVRDLSSTNGTFVNGEKHEGDRVLKDSDSIRLGASTVSFVFHSPTAATLQINLSHTEDGAPTEAFETVEPPESIDGLYEGTVRLRVEGSMGLVVHFRERLDKKPELRILRLARSRRGDTGIWLALREPLSIRSILGGVAGVSNVSPTRGRDLGVEAEAPPLTVKLKAAKPPAEPDWRACVYCREVLQPATTICPRCHKTQA